jgi:hypothetical protein
MQNKGIFAGVGVISPPASAGFKALRGIQGQGRTVSFPYFQQDTFNARSIKRPQGAGQQRRAEAPAPGALVYRQIVHFRLARRAVQADKHIGKQYPAGREKTEAEKSRFRAPRRGPQDASVLFRAEGRSKRGGLQSGNGIGVPRLKRGYTVFDGRGHAKQCSSLQFFLQTRFIPMPDKNCCNFCPESAGAKPEVPFGALPCGDAQGGRSRMAQTVRRLQAEAANILAGDRPPRTLPDASAAAYAVLPPAVENGLGEEERGMLGEVTDAAGRLLLCMPPDQALRRGLRLRLCAVVLRTGDRKVILHRETRPGDNAARTSSKRRLNRPITIGRSPDNAARTSAKRRPPRNPPGRSGQRPDVSLPWDIYTGHVLVGEAWESAALRLLETWAGTAASRLARLAEIDGEAAGGAHVRYYTATLVSGLYPKHAPEDTLEVDRDELAGLAETVPELLSRLLLPAVRMGILFP